MYPAATVMDPGRPPLTYPRLTTLLEQPLPLFSIAEVDGEQEPADDAADRCQCDDDAWTSPSQPLDLAPSEDYCSVERGGDPSTSSTTAALAVAAAASDAGFPATAPGDCNDEESSTSASPSSSLAREMAQDCYRTARSLRHFHYRPAPFGIFGLFQHLQGVRDDAEWAADAAARHSHGLPYESWTNWEDQRRKSRFLPLVTIGILLPSVAVFLLSLARNGWHVEAWTVNPMAGPSPDVLIRCGALQRSRVVEHGEWYRLGTAAILHAGAIHFAANALAIGLVGPAIERSHGASRTAAVFAISALAGNLASALFSPFQISMGASGGLLGWLGFCASDVWANRRLFEEPADGDYRFPRAAAALWLAAELLAWTAVGLTPYVDNFAHMFGFLYGFAAAVPLRRPPPNNIRVWIGTSGDRAAASLRQRRCAALGCAVLVLGGIVAQAAVLHHSTSNADVCKKCRYLSCVPFPLWTEHKWWHCDGCEYSTATTAVRDGRVWLDLTCPYGDAVSVPYPVGTDEETISSEFLPVTCRQSCQL